MFVAGVEGNQEKWKDCVSDTESVLGFAIGSMFVRNAFHGESKTKAATMVHEVREAFKNNLPNLPWMDDVTRQRSVEKVQYIKFYDLRNLVLLRKFHVVAPISLLCRPTPSWT